MVPRSYLFVPGNRAERFDKALACGCRRGGAGPGGRGRAGTTRPRARDAVARYLAAADEALRPRLVVRINDAATPWFDDDLAMLACGAGARS